MDTEQGLEAMKIVDARTTLPIHCNHYEAFQSPLEDVKRVVRGADLEERVHYLAHGDTYEFVVQKTPTGN
jgi:L-ascorbate metabolism protein UlaG (beta-lactamase superfamily)